MKVIAPPRPPTSVALDDGDGFQRLDLRLKKISLSTLTVMATAWCITLGPVPAVIALAVAKHILVAVLVMGQDGIDSEN